MATALVMLEAHPDIRDSGRWARGSVDIATGGNSESRWRSAVAEAGTILDWTPEVAQQVRQHAAVDRYFHLWSYQHQCR